MLDLFFPPKPPAIKPTRVVMLADVCPLRESVRRSGQVSEVDKAAVWQAKKASRLERMTDAEREDFHKQERDRYWRNRERILEVLRVKRERHTGPKLTPEQVKDRRNARKRELRALAKANAEVSE